jgi:hypothetical protein
VDSAEWTRIAEIYDVELDRARNAVAVANELVAYAQDASARKTHEIVALRKELAEAKDALLAAPHAIADMIADAAHAVDAARFERKTALLDAARIARGVAL